MNKQKKLLLAGGIAGAIALIGMVLLVLWLTLWTPPSKQDFAAAKKTADKIIEYQGTVELGKFTAAMNAEYRAGRSGQAALDAASDERQRAVNAADSRAKLAEQLRASKALRDPEVKKAFDTYASVEATYGAYIRNFASEYPKYMESAMSCMKVFKLSPESKSYKEIAEAHAATNKACLNDLAKLEKSPLPPYVAYAKEFKGVVNERQKVFDGLANNTVTPTAAVKRIAATNDKYRTIWPQDEVDKYRKTQTFDGELKKLADVLGEKASKSK